MEIINKLKELFLLAFIMGLAGCVTAEKVDSRLTAWVGRDADDLAASWGAPNGNYEKRDGGKILTYDRSVVRSVGSMDNPQSETSSCKINFTIDKDNKVASFTWSGSTKECDLMISE